MPSTKDILRKRKSNKIRKTVIQSKNQRPRLVVFRSNKIFTLKSLMIKKV